MDTLIKQRKHVREFFTWSSNALMEEVSAGKPIEERVITQYPTLEMSSGQLFTLDGEVGNAVLEFDGISEEDYEQECRTVEYRQMMD